MIAGSHGWLLLFGSVLAGAAGFFICSIVRRRLLYDLHKIPGPAGWPLLGNALDMLGPNAFYFHQLLADWTEKYGQMFIYHLGTQPVLAVTDPEEVARLCNNSNKQANLPKWSKIYLGTEPRAPHYSMLGTPDYEEWKSLRKTTSLAFSPENMRKAYPKVYRAALQASSALQKICKQGPVDVGTVTTRLTAEVISTVGFEKDLDAFRVETGSDGNIQLAHQPFLENIKTQLHWGALTLCSPWHKLLYTAMPWLAEAKRIRRGMQGARQNEDDLVKLFRGRGVQPMDNTSLWACLGRMVNYKDGKPVHHDTLAMNIGLFFIAGYETTAHTITWALLEVASDKTLQDRVRQELKEAGLVPTPQQPQPRDLEYADLSKLPILETIVKETLRLHPTGAIGSFRMTDRDMIVGGYRIPRNTPVQLPTYCMHLSNANFVQPHRFWPERWTQPTVSSTMYKDATPSGNRRNLSASWNPFSCGPHNCIGQALALAETRTALAVLLASFQFDLPDGFSKHQYLKREQVWRVTLQPNNELPLVVSSIVDHL